MSASVNKAQIKFLLFSAWGIFYFFIPAFSGKTLLLISVYFIETIAAPFLSPILLVFAACFCVCIWIKPPFSWLKKYSSNFRMPSKFLYLIGLSLGIITYLQVGPEVIISSDTGGLALSLAGDVFITVFIAGAFVTFLSSFGLLQFVGAILEPLMRPLYHLPGYAGMDIATSVTTSPAVDIFFSNKIYLSKLYTKKEVSSVVTNFSICSLGFFVVLCEMAGITQYYGQVVITSFLLSFIIPLITVRIPPLSRIPNEYYDGSLPEKNIQKERSKFLPNLKKAWSSAISAASTTTKKEFLSGIVDSFFFAIKIVCYILSIATICLAISVYTPFFQWLGIPLVPILQLFGIPDAAAIAPSVLVGITELALPTLLIVNKAVVPAASFFVIVLSTLQIIFFAESANAIMESSIPLKVGHLISIFLIRTIIAIPLVSIAMHIIFLNP